MKRGGAKVTVIMRTRNSERVVGSALAALFSQEYGDFELLVVDSGSTDRTLDIVGRYPHAIMRWEGGRYLPGAVLNAAVEAAGSELLVFQNSDCVPLVPVALGLLVEAVESGAAAAFARQVPRPDAWNWVRREYAAAFPPKAPAPPWMALSLPFAAMRRDAWELHPFQTRTWASEDTEWGCWAASMGLEVRYVPKALVMHSHNYTLSQLYGRRFVEGEADAFIHGARAGLLGTTARFLSRSLRDVALDAWSGDPVGAASAPVRRAVEAWAYLRGNRLGRQRLEAGDTSPDEGLAVALEHHGDAGEHGPRSGFHSSGKKNS